jgi:hypothetical protein
MRFTKVEIMAQIRDVEHELDDLILSAPEGRKDAWLPHARSLIRSISRSTDESKELLEKGKTELARCHIQHADDMLSILQETDPKCLYSKRNRK